LPFTREVVTTAADYLELGRYNPARQAPVLVYDGEVVADSTDILWFLEKRHPAPPLFPGSKERAALCHFLEDWSDEALSWYGSTLRWIDPRNGGVARKQLALGAARGVFARLFPGLGRFIGRIRTLGQGIGRRPIPRIEADLSRHLSFLANLLAGRPYLLGEEVSAADLAVWAQLRALAYCVQEDAVRRHEVVGPYLDRMDAFDP
jgi:glutathione S-transferase